MILAGNTMEQDQEHLDLLAIFHFVAGAMGALFGSCFLGHVGAGLAMVLGAFDGATDPPPHMLGWVFLLPGACIVLASWAFGVAMVMAGRHGPWRLHHYCSLAQFRESAV
jgi:hypothetical protein